MKKSLLTLTFGALFFTSTLMAAPVDYAVDAKGMHASINFKVQHLGISWLTGRFNKMEGDFSYDKNNISNSKIKMTIQTNSVNSNHAERDKHLRGKDFLNVSKFPTATFVSTAISENSDKTLDVKGNFTLNGVTKPITIKATKIGEGKDPWGGYRAGFTGTTEFKMADYGITYNLGPASTHVYLDLHIEGIKK